MAIYHCSLKIFTRSNGHSAVAAAAYRSGSVLFDERAGKTHRYDRRGGIKQCFILTPAVAPGKDFSSRCILWNAAEASETRKNSCVARELVLALPHELSEANRLALTKDMAGWLMQRYRVAVDAAIHIPIKRDDARNHHAHLLFTTREVTKKGMGKKTRILDDKKTGKEETEIIREVWETLANDALSKAGFKDIQIDRRTLEAQGIDRIPQIHIGPHIKPTSEEREEHTDTGAAKGGGGDSQTSLNKSKSDDEDKDGAGESEGDSGDPVSLTPQSKPKIDQNGRIIDYPAIDQNKTRRAFVGEIKKLNAQRAAFGDKPLRHQIKDLDKLMDRLDARIKHLEALYDKTSRSSRASATIIQALKTAKELFTNTQQSREVIKLSRKEEQARTERQISRYGKTYRKSIHTQIKDTKTNIELLLKKQQEYARYETFVEKLEQQIANHKPSISKQSTQPVRKTSNEHSSLKLKLKASVMREGITSEFKPKDPLKALLEIMPPNQKSFASTDSKKGPTVGTVRIDTYRLKNGNSFENNDLSRSLNSHLEKASETKLTPTLQKTFGSQAVKTESLRKEQDFKTRNVATFKGITRAIQRREPIKAGPLSDPANYRQPLKMQITGLKAEAQSRGRGFVPTQERINAKRAAVRTTPKGQFNNQDKSWEGPKKVSTRIVIARSKERASEARAENGQESAAKPVRKPLHSDFNAKSNHPNPQDKINMEQEEGSSPDYQKPDNDEIG